MTTPETSSTRFAKDQLRSIVERIERLEEEKKSVGDEIKEVYAEAKANGFDTATIKRIVKNRRIEPAERAEQETIYGIYWGSLGHDAEEPAYAELAASMGEELGREKALEALQQLVPLGATFDLNFGKGDKIRITRMDDGRAVIEPISDEPSAPLVRPGATLKRPATVLMMVPKESVKTPDDTEDEEKLYQAAVAAVREDGKASTSFIQRRLQIGYNRAAAMMERMETDGIVSAAGHDGKRRVLDFGRKETKPLDDQSLIPGLEDQPTEE